MEVSVSVVVPYSGVPLVRSGGVAVALIIVITSSSNAKSARVGSSTGGVHEPSYGLGVLGTFSTLR